MTMREHEIADLIKQQAVATWRGRWRCRCSARGQGDHSERRLDKFSVFFAECLNILLNVLEQLEPFEVSFMFVSSLFF